MPSPWSLVLFTLLVQSLVGNVWCLQLLLWFDGCRMDSLYFQYQILVALGLVLMALAAAMGHLGRPAVSIYAVRNIKRSWLSREITAVNLFAGTLMMMAALSFIKPEYLAQWMMLAGSLAGGTALFAMTRVYLLRTVPAWNHAGTPFTFLGSALLLGPVLSTILLQIFRLTMNIAPDTGQLSISSIIAFAFMSIGLILKMLAAGMYHFTKSTYSGSLLQRQPVMQTIGFTLWVVAMLPADGSIYPLVLFSLASGILVAGEVIHRIQFYMNYQRVGL